MNKKLIALLAVAALAVVAFFVLRPKDDKKEKLRTLVSKPVRPGPGEPKPPPGSTRMPKMPRLDGAELRKVYDDAKAAGKEMPGDIAFRAMIDKFMEYNAEFAKAKVDEEGLTMKEVTELTYLGFKVMTSQAPDLIEKATGRKLTGEEQELLVQLQTEANRDFTETMRQMVADEVSEDERWAFIQKTDDNYMKQFFAITGMTPEQWDSVLAENIAEIPEIVEPRPYQETKRRDQQRPGGR